MRVIEKTQAVAGINSLNSIQWNPRIQSNTSKETWEPGGPEENLGDRRRSSIRVCHTRGNNWACDTKAVVNRTRWAHSKEHPFPWDPWKFGGTGKRDWNCSSMKFETIAHPTVKMTQKHGERACGVDPVAFLPSLHIKTHTHGHEQIHWRVVVNTSFANAMPSPDRTRI